MRGTPPTPSTSTLRTPGVVETVSIPKGSAVDATARAAAAAAQADIEDHEANHPARRRAAGLDQDAVDARVEAGVADWAETGDTDLIPSTKLPVSAAGARGAVEASTNAIVDTEAGTDRLGWSINHLKRLIGLVLPAWTADDTSLLPVAKIPGSIARDAEVTTAIATHTAETEHGGGGGGGTHTEQRVLDQDPVGSAATDGKLQIASDGKVYSTIPDIELGVLATGDFAPFDHANYIGAFSGDPNPLSVPAGTYYFETVGHKLRKTALNSFNQLRWQDAAWSELLPTGARYRGNHDGDADALHHLTMDGDVYHNDTSPHRGIRQVSNFVAGSSSHTDYGTGRLAFVDDIPDLEDPLFVERSSLPDATGADAPALVFLTHPHREGNRADAVVTVGFTASGVAGYADGSISAAVGSINTPSPLLELFGLGDASSYLLESVYWGNELDLDEFSFIYLNSVRYVLGDLTMAPGGTVWLKRIIAYPTGLSIANLSINFQRADGGFYFNDSANELLERWPVPANGRRDG